MPEIIPFNAVRYGKKNISDLICPPYDVISPSEKKGYLKKSPYNAVRIELPRTYKSAWKNFKLWKSKQILRKDSRPSFYIYEQGFKYNGRKYKRTGFFALLKTEKLGGDVIPHEKTHAAPKLDRLNLLKTTRISTSPIFCLFSDSKKTFLRIVKKIKSKAPASFAGFSDTSEKMWITENQKTVVLLKDIIKNSKILIADGHHRYETFFEFTKGGHILAFLCPFADKGLLILPTHRLVKNWSEKDTLKLKKFVTTGKNWDIKLYFNGGFYNLKIPKKKNSLPVEFLHSSILKNKKSEYTMNEKDAVRQVDDGRFAACFILKPVNIAGLKYVMKNKKLLPQKSTYFYPKVPTGFLFNELN